MKEYVRLIVVLLLPLLLLLAYSVSGRRLVLSGWSVSKVRMSGRYAGWLRTVAADTVVTYSAVSAPPVEAVADTAEHRPCAEAFVPDTCGKRILFFGDSMVEGLAMRFSDYAGENGHTLYTVCWYGSSTTGWAANPDTLRHCLDWAQPDFVVVSLGGNELRVTDLESRDRNVRSIQSILGERPTVWIAPPSWVKNPTITEVIRSAVGDNRYFDSTKLKFNRGADNMHPTFGSSARWMDSIAVWMSSPQTAHPIRMNPPSVEYPRKWHRRFIYPK